MRPPFFILLLAFALLGTFCRVGQAADAITLPFGLRWGVASQDVEAALVGSGARIAERKGSPGEVETLIVEGVNQEGLNRLVLSFAPSGLAALELQYQKEGWTYATYDELMHRVRRNLEDRYGVGRQVARTRDQNEQVWQTMVRYAWPIGAEQVELVYFCAQDEQHSFGLVSLHYAAQAKALPKPVGRSGVTVVGSRFPSSRSASPATAEAGEPSAVSAPLSGGVVEPLPSGAEGNDSALFPAELPPPPTKQKGSAARRPATAFAEPALPTK